MDLDTIKLVVGILFGIYATLVIVDAYLMHQFMEDFGRLMGLSEFLKKPRLGSYLFYIRSSLMLTTLRCNLALYRAVRMAEKCLSKSKSTRT
jgi:hypothetical protein